VSIEASGMQVVISLTEPREPVSVGRKTSGRTTSDAAWFGRFCYLDRRHGLRAAGDERA